MKIYLVIFSSLSFLLGCTPKLSEDGRFIEAPVIDTSHPRATLVTASNQMQDKIKILNPLFKEVGLLSKAQVRIQNLTKDRYTIEYRFTWEDKEGFRVGNEGVWQRVTLIGGQTQAFSSMGKTPEAKMIIFTARWPDDVFINLDKRVEEERKKNRKK